MSRAREEQVTCPACGSTGTTTIWDSVNPTMDPPLKAELLEGRLLTYVCPNCESPTHLEHNLLYHDMDQQLLIWLTYGPEKVPDPRAMHLFEVLKLPYTKRIVRSPRHLAEKILAFDGGLDDRVIEVMKVMTWREAFGPERPASDEYCFMGLESDADGGSLLFVRITGRDPEDWLSVDVEFEHYEDLAAALAPHLTHRVSDGWWEVDVGFAVQLFSRVDADQ